MGAKRIQKKQVPFLTPVPVSAMDTIERSTPSRSDTAAPEAALYTRERRITVEEYRAMGEAGILSEDDRIELLDGHLISTSPIGPSHAHCVNRLTELFGERKGTAIRVSVQNPVHLDDVSEPEPDLVLYDSTAPTSRHLRPGDTFLVVEVADTSIEYDRDVKSDRYSQAGIPEYWVVDLANEVVEVFRRPEDDGYAERIRHRRGDTLTITALPDLDPLTVDDILGEAE